MQTTDYRTQQAPVASTGTSRTITTVWDTRPVRCECGQTSTEGQTPTVFDATGTGSFEYVAHVKCGNCGDTIRYAATITESGHTSNIEEARTRVQRAHDGILQHARGKVIDRLGRDVADTIEGGDFADLPNLDEMMEPGVGRRGDWIVAWDYDPAGDPEAGDMVDVAQQMP